MLNFGSRPSNRVWLATGAAVLLVITAGELFFSSRQQSQTSDEAVHILAGYEAWKSFDFGINPEHPPLVKLVAALPLLRSTLRAPSLIPNIDIMGLEFSAGHDFLYGNDAATVLQRTRMAAATFTICLGLAILLVAYSIGGTGPAFVALTLFAFEPNFLGHGALVTTDVGASFGIFLGAAAFHFYWKSPSAWRLLGAGLAAGTSLGAKHSGVLLFPMLLLLAFAEVVSWRDLIARKFAAGTATQCLRLVAALVAVAGISLLILWSLYGFRYAARPPGLTVDPGLPGFAERHMGSVSSVVLLALARVHLFPEAYLYGLGVASARRAVPTIILGKYYPSAQWFYFPAVFAIKSTLAFLVLLCLAPLSGAIRNKGFRRDLLFLTIPPAVYLCVAVSSGLNLGVRHILPVYPFLIVLVSVAAWNLATLNRGTAILVAVLVAFHIASSLRAFPNYIPYANEAWGGPARTHELLADSSVDWGQGLIALHQYIERHQITDCWFSYFGSTIVDVSYYGIPCKPLPTEFSQSSQLVTPIVPPQVDVPVFLSVTEATAIYWRPPSASPYSSLKRITPSAVIAGSILAYDGKIDTSQVAALTHENLAAQLKQERKFEEALVETATAAQIAPNRPGPHVIRSATLGAMGRRAEAAAEINKANSMQSALIDSH